VALVRDIPTKQLPLVGKISINFFFADRGCRVVSATDPYSRILGFPDQGRYHFLQEA
jgi:hypothetical protein